MRSDPGKFSATDLLPHKGKMLLVNDILEISEEVAVSRSRVNANWPLVANQAASALLIVELVAQTAGLSNGFTLINRQGEDANKKGWVVGIKKARFYIDQLPVGADINTRAENTFKFDEFVEVEGSAKIGTSLIGEVILQVMKAG